MPSACASTSVWRNGRYSVNPSAACITAYLSQAPERVEHAFFTGGIPTLQGADDLYCVTFSKLKSRQQRFYHEFPWAQSRIEEIISHLDNSDECLPTGERLSSLRFRTIGSELGRGTGFDSLAYLLEEPFRTVAGGEAAARRFLGGRRPARELCRRAAVCRHP